MTTTLCPLPSTRFFIISGMPIMSSFTEKYCPDFSEHSILRDISIDIFDQVNITDADVLVTNTETEQDS